MPTDYKFDYDQNNRLYPKLVKCITIGKYQNYYVGINVFDIILPHIRVMNFFFTIPANTVADG